MQPIIIHFSKAVAREASVVRYIEILRKGYASPSLDADSATSRLRMSTGTYLSANPPPTEPKGAGEQSRLTREHCWLADR